MKCVFAATPYYFSVQYHANALVLSHANNTWEICIDGIPTTYRMLECRDAPGDIDLRCAVFVPATLGRHAAGRLVAGFKTAHPGVIPAHMVFQFDRLTWWAPRFAESAGRLRLQA